MPKTKTKEVFKFSGDDYKPNRDYARLATQILRIRGLMLDGVWRTNKQIAELTGDPENSISAQMRNLRKRENGSFIMTKRYLGDGLYEYHLAPPLDQGRKPEQLSLL